MLQLHIRQIGSVNGKKSGTFCTKLNASINFPDNFATTSSNGIIFRGSLPAGWRKDGILDSVRLIGRY